MRLVRQLDELFRLRGAQVAIDQQEILDQAPLVLEPGRLAHDGRDDAVHELVGYLNRVLMELPRENPVLEIRQGSVSNFVAGHDANGRRRAGIVRKGKEGEADLGRGFLHRPAREGELSHFHA